MSRHVAPHRRDSRRLRRPTLRVEQLEDRSLLSTGYSFTPVAAVGNPAPGPEGGTFTFDFELGGLNNRSQVVFAADLNQGGGLGEDDGEGIFLGGKGGLSQVIRFGEAAPGGGTFGGFGSFSPSTINDSGDAAFAFGLNPLSFPIELNAGVYRYDHASGQVTAVLVPGVTAAPGGGTFQGTAFHPALNNAGDLVFTGLVPATIGPGAPLGLGLGIFVADQQGHLAQVVRPGDPAPGGSVFDFAQNPSIDDRGDVAFGAHVAADPRIGLGQDLPITIFSAESVYVRDGRTGAIQSIAHQGDAIPASAGGGTFDYAYSPVLNSRGQVLFDAGLRGTSSGAVINGVPADSQAIFLWSGGELLSIARQGDAMPGGGHLVSASFNPGNYDLNNSGDVAFNALLDNGKEGVFLWSHGSLTLVAETGTVIPGVGTIASLDQYGTGLPNGLVSLNDRGQVAFTAVLTDGGVVLLMATPGGEGNSDVPAVRLARAAPAGRVSRAEVDLPGIDVALALGGQNSSNPAEPKAPSQPATSGSTSARGTVVVPPQQVTSSSATEWSSGAKRSPPSAADDLSATFPESLGADPFA
jgi:hypothetical protein